MYTKYLFPHSFKKVGWIILIFGIISGIIFLFFDNYLPNGIFETNVVKIYSSDGKNTSNKNDVVYKKVFESDNGKTREYYKQSPKKLHWFIIGKNDISDEVTCILLIIGSILVACSKEKNEDEFIAKIRLESLLWATYINFILLISCILFIYNEDFLWVMSYNMFTLLLIFTFRFNFILYKASRALKAEDKIKNVNTNNLNSILK